MTAPIVLHRGDCLDILPTLPADHIEAKIARLADPAAFAAGADPAADPAQQSLF